MMYLASWLMPYYYIGLCRTYALLIGLYLVNLFLVLVVLLSLTTATQKATAVTTTTTQ